jgi:uncharacterized membrane protein YhaH (DUF805 family)
MNGYLAAYPATWKKAFDYKGRASRKEYWLFVLFNLVVLIAYGVFWVTLGKTLGSFFDLSYAFSLITVPIVLFSMATFVACLALNARRLHDIGLSGWWQILLHLSNALSSFMLPKDEALTGQGLVLALFCLVIAGLSLAATLIKGQGTPNTYGPPPAK